jgi:hypothetical protein
MALMGLLWLAPCAIREERQAGVSAENAGEQVSAATGITAPSSNRGETGPVAVTTGVQRAVASAAASSPSTPVTVVPANTGTVTNEPVSLDASPVAAYWLEQYGITAEDIRQTLERLRAEGVPEHILRDAGAVFVRLPRRNVHAVTIGTLELPAAVVAGEPVPYRLTGRLPDASHTFTHLAATRIDDRILLQPLGTRSGDPAPGIEVPVELDGELEPLPPGRYRIEYPGQPATEERYLLVE